MLRNTLLVALVLLTVATIAASQDCPSCQQWAVAVIPDGGATAAPLNSGPHSVVFVVENTGTMVEGETYTLTCSSTGGITCGTVTPSSVYLQPDETAQVTVTFSIGSTAGDVRLTATDMSTDLGWYAVSSSPAITIAAPILTSGSRAVVRNRQPVIRALFATNGSPIDSTKTVLLFRSDTVSTLARANRGLIEWDVDSARWISVGDSALITVKACAQNTLCTTVTRWAVLPADNKPVLGFTGVPFEAPGRQFAAPFGPRIALSGAEIETGFSAPPYVSMGAGRTAALVYSTRQSYPRALVPIDLELTWPVGTPDQIKVLLWDGAVKLDSVVLSSPTCATGAARRCRTVLQGDFSASSFSTPTRKWLKVEARVTSSSTTEISTDSVEVVLVDRRTTRYGSGWWPAGVLQLVAVGGDRILVGASGTVSIFRGNGDSLYLSPPGDFTVLKRTPTVWELSPRGSLAKLVFDANGRLIRALDANGNKDSIVYNGSTDQVTALRDPVGRSITFAYDGNGKLSTLTDPASRQTRVVIDASSNQLTYDSLPSSTSRPYTTRYAYQTYSGTGTVVLTKRIGVINDTTIVTYDSTFRRRPSQVRLASVQDETGTTVWPAIQYTAVERQGWQALRSLDSAYVELKDPRNNWTRSLLDRWGQARSTWDALGLIGRSAFTGEGLVLWSEGKTGDSSRVYNRYDALRRLIRSYIVRSSSDTLKFDSLVYDANHRVIQILRQTAPSVLRTWRIAYDSKGNVTSRIEPGEGATYFWYRSDGLLDSTRAPDETRARRFTYEGTHKNLLATYDENGNLVAENGYDSAGRVVLTTSGRRRVRTGTADSIWYSRREPFLTVTNQTDSVRVSQAIGDCLDLGCPPEWPLPSDTVLTQRVGYRFDRAGRDSLRLNDRAKATMYLHDRLGRLVSRRPWTDSMAVRDSMVYDIAGNLRKTITRRGDTITTTYDSRNRDTATVIPGVGTLRRAFTGPLDQVTRLWFDSFIDSIGGVNPELRWGFDQRGRLKADTSYTGTTVRATTYAYDALERVVTTVDPRGTWTTRFEEDRGIPDTLITPFSDTLTYGADKQRRALGPYFRSSGPLQSRVPTFSQVGALKTLPHTVATSPSFVAGKWDRAWNPDSSGPPLLPLWIEQHGSGASLDSLRDSTNYDGWGRVTAWVQRKLGTAWVARDTLRFDRLGNIKTTAGAEVYDVTTGRLLSRTDGGGTWNYTYDRAGNLVQAVQSSITWVYGYDALNRLRSVRRNGTVIARYAYDVAGRRIVKRVYSSASGGIVVYKRFVYRGANVAFETDSGGTISLKYVWGPAADDLLAIHDTSGNAFYVAQDLLHTPRGLVKRDGTWVLSQRFGPYGVRLAADSAGTGPGFELRYRWTGREYDVETGFYFHRSRYYDPVVRRFVQEDKIAYAGGANVYAYAEGSPLGGRDPDGRRMDREPNPDWFNLDVFSGCFYFQCAEIEYFFGLTGSGGGSGERSYDSLGCIGNAGCVVDEQFLEAVYNYVQALELLSNVALAAMIYNETASLRGSLEEARAVIARVILNRISAGLRVGDGVGTAVDFLSGREWDAIEAGHPAAVDAWYESMIAAASWRGGDFTGGALYFYIERTLPSLPWLQGAPTFTFGPFQNSMGSGNWYIWAW